MQILRPRPGRDNPGPIAMEDTMKLFMFLVVAVLIIGGINHTEVSQYFADLTEGYSNSDGETSIVDSIQGVGDSSNALLGGVGNTLNR